MISGTKNPVTEPWATAQLSDADYDFLCRLIYERSRIHLGPDKRVLVSSRLSKRLRQLNLDGYGAYCDRLRSPAGADELQILIDRISTNHTHFFREQKHFDFLREQILPAWKPEPGARGEAFRIWSAAASTGEEPYTIAVTLAESLAPAESGAWRIDASDISTRVLDVARRGVYDAERLAGMSPDLVRRHFQKGVNEWEGHFRVKPELRGRVQFHHLNLLEPPYPFAQPFQVIFCRNVMIYFDRPTQTDLIAHLTGWLAPGGHLFVGHSESLGNIKHTLKPVQPAIYQKQKA
jgi:chemotaxis protein methyltransferase CheR